MRNDAILTALAYQGIELLCKEDPQLHELFVREFRRQASSLVMVAASSIADPSVLACEGMVTSNVTTEGYPGARFHAGCKIVDEIEQLAIDRAKLVFQAQYANVQPHSGTSANEIVLCSLLKPGDTFLGLELNSGGHLTHGSVVSISGQYFNAIGYGLRENGFIDYDQVYMLACKYHPKLIICGASAYPRVIDFKQFRSIADEVGAYVLADISHIAGLVASGEHPNPIDDVHFTTTSTYKQLYGPRGGMILMGKDYQSPAPEGKKTLAQMIQRAVFPFFQGTPNLSSIAAKARALAMVMTPEFKMLAHHIVVDAKCLAQYLIEKDYAVLTGGTDNHLVLVDVLANGITGVVAERALEECNIIVNKNRIPGDKKAAHITSGIRLGTNSLALRKMGIREMVQCGDLIHQVLSSITIYSDTRYQLVQSVKKTVQTTVEYLCCRFPIPRYPVDFGEERGGVQYE